MLIHNICTAVFSIVGFGIAQRFGFFLPETDGFDLVAVDAQQLHHACDGFGTALAEREVVFRASARVGIAFDAHFLLSMRSKVLGVHFNQMTVLIGYYVTVKVEINRPLLGTRTLGVERNHDLVGGGRARSDEHTSELQSLMRISYAVFCLKKKNNT